METHNSNTSTANIISGLSSFIFFAGLGYLLINRLATFFILILLEVVLWVIFFMTYYTDKMILLSFLIISLRLYATYNISNQDNGAFSITSWAKENVFLSNMMALVIAFVIYYLIAL